MARPRISVPITLTSALVAISVALTVGWEILVAREFRALVGGFTAVHWLLVVVGAVLFAGIIAASILQTVWLVQEIRTGQRQRSFIDAVTHELHTPLTALRLYLETLQGLPSGQADEAKREEFLGIMGQELDRLERTVGHILRAARSEEAKLRRDRVALGPLLEECVREVCERHGLEEKAIRVSGVGGLQVRGDAEHLRLAFRNLLENSVRYAGEKVRVDVTVRPTTRRRVEIELADRGVGIGESDLERIFERFQRLSPAVLRARRGLGLGLYVVRSVVRQHKGSVHAESAGPGKGSRFIVTLRRTRDA
jgi:signal transduction histidine kinase